MIYIVGDTHGLHDFEHVKESFESVFVTRKDILIILGDAGILWEQNRPYIDEYESLGLTVIYIDGNHENFDMIKKCPVIEKWGAKVHKISEHIFHVCRGEILSLNGVKFFCMGGASSHDKAAREVGKSWWPDEDITEDDYQNALSNLEKHNWTVDYVLSHCCPEHVNMAMFHYKNDINTEYLYKLYKLISFKKWFFGHYHTDKDRKYGNIEYCAMYYNIKVLHHYDDGSIDGMPEWMYKGISLKGVKHLSIEENGKIAKVLNDSQNTITGFDIVDLIRGIEKYSPNYDVTPFKENANADANELNNRSSDFMKLPFIEVPLKAKRNFTVEYQDIIFGSFDTLQKANEYAIWMKEWVRPAMFPGPIVNKDEFHGRLRLEDGSHIFIL